jgi:hypothetical protein
MTRPSEQQAKDAKGVRLHCDSLAASWAWMAVHVAESVSLLLQPSQDDDCNMNDDGKSKKNEHVNAKKCWYMQCAENAK